MRLHFFFWREGRGGIRNHDDSIACLKANLEANNYAQTYGVDYGYLLQVTKPTHSVFLSTLLPLIIGLYQIDVKNSFLHCHLAEVYMKLPLGFVQSWNLIWRVVMIAQYFFQIYLCKLYFISGIC